MTEESESNYSIDMLKRAAFVAEASDIEISLRQHEDPALQMVMAYLNNRIDQIEKKYKKAS